MLRGLLYFLVGSLILVVVLYVANLVIARMHLPSDVASIALLILGLVGLVFLFILVARIYKGGGGPPLDW